MSAAEDVGNAHSNLSAPRTVSGCELELGSAVAACRSAEEHVRLARSRCDAQPTTAHATELDDAERALRIAASVVTGCERQLQVTRAAYAEAERLSSSRALTELLASINVRRRTDLVALIGHFAALRQALEILIVSAERLSDLERFDDRRAHELAAAAGERYEGDGLDLLSLRDVIAVALAERFEPSSVPSVEWAGSGFAHEYRRLQGLDAGQVPTIANQIDVVREELIALVGPATSDWLTIPRTPAWDDTSESAARSRAARALLEQIEPEGDDHE